ncbi:unnamed protein product, partial [Amoebophrya sp. A25]
RRVHYRDTLRGWKFATEQERRDRESGEKLREMKASRKASISAIIEAHTEANSLALQGKFFVQWHRELEIARKADKAKKLEIAEQVASHRLEMFKRTALDNGQHLFLQGAFIMWREAITGQRLQSRLEKMINDSQQMKDFLGDSMDKQQNSFTLRACFHMWHAVEVQGARAQQDVESKLKKQAFASRQKLAQKFLDESAKGLLQFAWTAWKHDSEDAVRRRQALEHKQNIARSMHAGTGAMLVQQSFAEWAHLVREVKYAEEKEKAAVQAKLARSETKRKHLAKMMQQFAEQDLFLKRQVLHKWTGLVAENKALALSHKQILS